MKRDRSYKIILSAITILLCANLLIALRARPSQAQQAKGNPPHYQVIRAEGYPGDDIERTMNSKANEGYHFKGIAGDHSAVFIIMEK